MHINILEKAARQVLKGENSDLNSTMLSPTEHRSLKSLSWQIAANVNANSGVSSGTLAYVKPMRVWG